MCCSVLQYVAACCSVCRILPGKMQQCMLIYRLSRTNRLFGYIYVRACVCMYVYIYIYICIYLMYIYARPYIYIQKYTNIQMCICMYIYINSCLMLTGYSPPKFPIISY